MKKIILATTVAIISSIGLVLAQPRAIGGRIGPNVELSFQQYTGSSSMLQIDAGITYFKGAQLNLTHSWLSSVNSSSSSGTWTSFGGFGVGGGYSWNGDGNAWYPDHRKPGADGSYKPALYNYGTFGIVGIVGIEYMFSNIPLALAFDYRPLFGVDMGTRLDNKFAIQYYLPGLWNCGLSARFTF